MEEAPRYTTATGASARKVFRSQHHKAAERDLAADDGHYFSLMDALMVLVEGGHGRREAAADAVLQRLQEGPRGASAT
ncbi:hypothetical protein DL766_002769 [Monosporascus sp. MC13-8B]|uniref:Uncharacterized protein n=1 Tax=Monosporascus cannonballus TaxID=155416 RepID=A0ABY0HK59_9PEZI|nr:hypothetical protein DL762_000517 [Monosporascus cannonballus]RYO96028.1 hypothetical protein DL763_003420 [Monosporascus cannonballus]RYP34871.1 hypothetical protein DL766_002769 [Monosporascus sp. MC13-8B]